MEVAVMCWLHLYETGIRSEARSLAAVWAVRQERGLQVGGGESLVGQHAGWVLEWYVEVWSLNFGEERAV